jgi:hypothetical protein
MTSAERANRGHPVTVRRIVGSTPTPTLARGYELEVTAFDRKCA